MVHLLALRCAGLHGVGEDISPIIGNGKRFAGFLLDIGIERRIVSVSIRPKTLVRFARER